MTKRRHEGNPYRVHAAHKDTGGKLVRVTDGRGVRLLVECGYQVDKLEELKSQPASRFSGERFQGDR